VRAVPAGQDKAHFNSQSQGKSPIGARNSRLSLPFTLFLSAYKFFHSRVRARVHYCPKSGKSAKAIYIFPFNLKSSSSTAVREIMNGRDGESVKSWPTVVLARTGFEKISSARSDDLDRGRGGNNG